MMAAIFQARPRSSHFVVFMTAWMGWLTTALAFKTADFPIELINSTNSTVAREANKVIARNLAFDMKQMNTIPDPSLNKSGDNETGDDANKTETEAEGMGGLGRTLEFLMLKVTQLETLCELQQTEIVSLRKTVKEHLDADHKDSKVALVQNDPDTHMEEVQATLKGVLKKHARQLQHREFHPKARTANQAELLEKRRKTTKADAASLESSVSSKIPIVSDVYEFGKDRVNDVKDGTGLVGDALGDAYEFAEDKIDFVARTTIDTVQKAVDILARGFTDWRAWCPTSNMPWVSPDNNGLTIDFGHVHCAISLMGQAMTLFNFNFGKKYFDWPQALRSVTHGKIMDLMPNPVKTVADGQIMSLLPGQLNQIVSGDINGLLPRQLRQIVSGDINGLLPGQLKQIVSGDINGLLPRQLRQIVSGDINGLLPGQLRQIASGDIMGLMPGPMQFLGGSDPNSVENMVKMGTELTKCSEAAAEGDLVQCLGFKIIGRVPPLNFLNRLGDIFAEFIAAFATVASKLAAQAMKGGESGLWSTIL